jgi:uncharacterized protein (DUF362 family)/NAD-dependent dihydropyrimidine dehydrogenase PreA subunit
MSKVALVKCCSYEENLVREAVQKGIELIGGIGQFALANEKILLKPNLLVAETPQKCVTTHPVVFRAVAELLQTTGAKLSFGDSPAVGSTKRVAKKAGLLTIAEKLGIELADFKNGVEKLFEAGIQNKKFVIAKGVVECDGLISLPKLKTHALERFTGSVKNQFGCVPGFLKGEFHVKIPDAHDFGKMLVDLNNLIKPRLYVMDGIQAMEGNGPRGGKPIQMNVLLFSSDPIALDATVCRLVNIDPEFVPTIKHGMETGAGTHLKEEITLLGDEMTTLKNSSFDIKREAIRPFSQKNKSIAQFLNNRLVLKPQITNDKCTSCGTCVSMCPVTPKAINWDKENKKIPPVYNYDLCIRCYCCQELCPDSAIELKKPLLRKISGFFR